MERLNSSLGVVTNLGVIAGLFLVAYQVNQTNVALERDYDAWMTTTQFNAQELFIDWGATIADRDTAELWWKGIHAEELDPIDDERFYRLAGSYFWLHRTMSFAWQQIDGGGEGPVHGLAQQLQEHAGLRKRSVAWHAQEGSEFSASVLELLQ